MQTLCPSDNNRRGDKGWKSMCTEGDIYVGRNHKHNRGQVHVLWRGAATALSNVHTYVLLQSVLPRPLHKLHCFATMFKMPALGFIRLWRRESGIELSFN